MASAESAVSSPRVAGKCDPLLRRFLDRLAAIKQREILFLLPERRQIAIMRAVGVAGLAGGIDGAGGIPVADIDHHLERPAGGDPEIIRTVSRGVGRETAAALRERSDIQHLLFLRAQDGGQRVFEIAMVKVGPFPARHAGSKLLLKFRHRRLQGIEQQGIAGGGRIVTKAAGPEPPAPR